MERIFSVVVLVFLMIPITITSTSIDPTSSAAPSSPLFSSSSSSSSAFSVGRNIFKKLKCTDFVKEQMVTKVLDHLKASDAVKKTLKTSAEFGVCVANNFCDCLATPYQPVIYACLAELGLKCMKDALSSNSIPCTNFVKEEMVTKVLDHLKASDAVKKTLKTSAKFGVCVANNFCDCLASPYQPVIYACLAELGLKCMTDALSNSPP
ncbi:uncharacterized protein LOC133796359 [Humulus lupulus]|uniref:uncharacterized protein LOC133796359 n=1 Tax=Humulus lupulus TaxID=3486 RepID=UPI002B416E99|nr:uncharacterized protein LOC133796359 [Humulus lupulus]